MSYDISLSLFEFTQYDSLKMDNKVLLYCTGNFAQCYVEAWTGGEFGGEWIHVYVRLSLFAVYLKLSRYY